ncbi:uncharacterized protein LOC119837321 [Zerene cesonia]|uniref:uncharacterized protein LOC119837321 n=1 Tax=Zerene cesonia TaxID=33412 RepID=UPI0018E4F038|nr:uncharacterized protein LOC119837321 [Zerene cesonia]
MKRLLCLWLTLECILGQGLGPIQLNLPTSPGIVNNPSLPLPDLPSGVTLDRSIVPGNLADLVRGLTSSEDGAANEYEEGIERPCRVFDLNCIRRYFSTHGKCKEVYGPVPDPLYRAQSTEHLPRLNLTYTGYDITYRGENGKIEEFYINRKTNRLLLALQLRNFNVLLDKFYLRFQRRGREPVVRSTTLNVTYAALTLTIIIPNLKDLQFDKSEVFTFAEDANPPFSIDPNLFLTADPTVLQGGTEFLLGVPINEQEGFFKDSIYYITSYIQYAICDFGYKLF